MDLEQKRIEEDLRGIVTGEVLCDNASRALYATDASVFEIWPLAVVRPRSVEDVAATVAWAAAQRISVHPRGAGSSLAGDSLGSGIVIDCSRFMRRIIQTGATDVRVQAGVVSGQLEEHLGRLKRTFGPDPSNSWVTTVGGMIGRNASGSRFLRYGAVRNRIAAAQVVLADGSIVEMVPAAPQRPAPAPASQSLGPARGNTLARLTELATGVAAILDSSRALVASEQSGGRVSHGGYRFDGLEIPGASAAEENIDLPRLLCGAAGTLGIITEATLRTEPADGATAVALVLFDSLDKAAQAALRLQSQGLSACDLFDKRHLALARSSKVAFDLLIPPVADAGLLIECVGNTPTEANARIDEALKLLQRSRGFCLDVRRAEDDFDRAFFWELSRNVVSTLHGVRGTLRPVAFMEDIVVPPAALPEFLRRLQVVLKQNAATAMLFAHAGHGQMHVRPFADPRDPAECERLQRLADALYAEVVSIGGTIGGEQGLGLSRTAFFTRYFPELSGVCGALKKLFDPLGILNPGKIVPTTLSPASSPSMATLPFRPALTFSPSAAAAVTLSAAVIPAASQPAVDVSLERELLSQRQTPAEAFAVDQLLQAPAATWAVSPSLSLPILNWSAETMLQEVDACNGCGACRSQSNTMRMCPRYRENQAEEASPRAKANLMAAFLTGKLDPKSLSADAVHAITDTCFNCHQCRVDCSAGVDIPAIVMELKAAHVAANSLGTTAWLLSQVDALSAFGGAIKPLANRAIANPQARWLLEKVLGLAQGRKLPLFSGNQLLRWAARRGLTRPSRRSGTRVLYFLDTYARRHDPLLAQAFVAVLEHNGIGVFIDPRQVASGMPLVSAGDVDGARRLARTNLRVLAEAVRLGYRIVCTEPATVTCLTHDYPLLIDDLDMPRVVNATCDAMTFLAELHRAGQLRLDFKPLKSRILYHTPCHLRTGSVANPTEHVLRLIPELNVQAVDRGCSGMAGTFGLSREHYRASLRAGLGLLSAIRSTGIEAGATECSACRIQMEQGTTKPTVHPIKLLAKAYGLLDGPGPHKLDGLLTATSGRLTTS